MHLAPYLLCIFIFLKSILTFIFLLVLLNKFLSLSISFGEEWSVKHTNIFISLLESFIGLSYKLKKCTLALSTELFPNKRVGLGNCLPFTYVNY